MLRLVALLLYAIVLGPAPSWAGADVNTIHGLRVVAVADLPPETRATLVRIKRGGPFPYQRDGVVFNNFERRLPERKKGYYREYTVPTPGAPDRGARRS